MSFCRPGLQTERCCNKHLYSSFFSFLQEYGNTMTVTAQAHRVSISGNVLNFPREGVQLEIRFDFSLQLTTSLNWVARNSASSWVH